MANSNMYINSIVLRRTRKVVPENIPNVVDSGHIPEETKAIVYAASAIKNMETLGFLPDEALLKKMQEDSTLSLKIDKHITPMLSKLVGADVEYEPMYYNFPHSVMNASDSELYFNAIIHYISGGTLYPAQEKENRMALDENVQYKYISLGEEKDVDGIMKNILNSSTPWSESDITDLKTLIAAGYNISENMPGFMTNRENLAVLSTLVSDKNVFTKQIRTATDVLRIMNVNHGDGDPSLKNKVIIHNMSRSERRFYLEMLENCKDLASDMKVNQILWVKVGQILHPGEYAYKYRKTATAFDSMRDNEKAKTVRTFNAKVEHAISSNDKHYMNAIFSEKPGMLARNLDRIVRDASNKDEVLEMWSKNAKNVDANLLWQVYTHFDKKEQDGNPDVKVFTIQKGKESKNFLKEDKTTPIDSKICNQIKTITENALKEKYKNKPPMGNVYIDPEVAKCKVPNETRGSQESSVPMAKGSRIPISGNANVVRGFIWWTNPKDCESDYYGRTDIDLSSVFLDKNFKIVDMCSYYNLHSRISNLAVHSGDITDGGDFNGKGVAEFVDVDMNIAKERNIKYVAFSVNSFTEQPFKNIEHIRFGFMNREKQLDGEIFEPKTVQQCVKLNANSTVELPCLFDVENREMVWVEGIGNIEHQKSINNVSMNAAQNAIAWYKAVNCEKPDIYDVIRVNVEARGGKLVGSKEKADLMFALNEGIRPTELEYFSGNLIPEKLSQSEMEKFKKSETEKEQKEEKFEYINDETFPENNESDYKSSENQLSLDDVINNFYVTRNHEKSDTDNYER